MERSHEDVSHLRKILNSAGSQAFFKRKIIWLVCAAIAVVLAGAVIVYASTGKTQVRYKTAEVKKGELTVTVTATGNLQPMEQVEVGTEVSGTIKTVLVDYNSRVKKGDVLAKLDTTKLDAQVLQSEATLEYAKAKLEEAKATEVET